MSGGREAGRKGAAVSRAGWGLDAGQLAAASAGLPAPPGELALHCDRKRGQERAPGVGAGLLAPLCLASVTPTHGTLTSLCHLIHRINFLSPQILPSYLGSLSCIK